MKHPYLNPLSRLLSGFTVTVFLGFLAEPLLVYAGSDDPEQTKFKARPAGEPLPAAENPENLEKRPLKLLSSAALWLEQGNGFFKEKNYPEAFKFYEKAAEKVNEEGKHGLMKIGAIYLEEARLTEAVTCYQKASLKGVAGASEKLKEAVEQLIFKGDKLYRERKVEEAVTWYIQALGYGSEAATERVFDFGVEAGDSHVAKNNRAEALRCYEQAAFCGNKEAKKKLEEMKKALLAKAASERVKPTSEPKLEMKPERPTSRLAIPAIAQGYEAIYERFLEGKLVYRPTEGSDVGMVTLPISALTNPLEGTFDLSRCGDTGKYVSIATGYRKKYKPENASKVEIWLAPRFLIEKEINGSASHFKDIMGQWDAAKAPVGLFFTHTSWDLEEYDYLTTQNWAALSSENFYKKSFVEHHSTSIDFAVYMLAPFSRLVKFHVQFMK
jgi:tetratricopeptide (TPR) repeat protein